MAKTTKPALATGALLGATIAAGMLVPATAANAHAWTTGEIEARAAILGNNQGPIQYEPQSLEAPGGFPATGPSDGKIASANEARGPQMDEQSADRWIKNDVTPGPVSVGWRTFDGYIGSDGDHKTDYIDYWITKVGWDPNDKLDRNDFELLEHKEYNGETVMTIGEHTINVPDTHSGYHVILGVWEVDDTEAAFYNVMDVNISGDAPEPVKDTERPSAVSHTTVTALGPTEAALVWGASTDNVGVDHYKIYANGKHVKTVSGSDKTATTLTGLTAGTFYSVGVMAFDKAGNRSTMRPAALHTPAWNGGPAAPTGLHQMNVTATTANIMWTASASAGPVDYEIFRNGKKVATTGSTSHTDTGLTADSSYVYAVRAIDRDGKPSPMSNEITVKTKGDTTHPAWNPFGAYTKGDKVTHQGNTYEAVQTHQGHGDPSWITALSLWKKN